MTAPVCANGHPATMVDQQFCAVCGAPFQSPPPATAPAPQAAAPRWGSPAPQPAPQQPAPPTKPAAQQWGAPAPQQAPVPQPAAPQWGAPAPQQGPVPQPGYGQPGGYGQPPAARGGMGKGALLVGVIAIVALAGGALFMLKGPSGTPSPTAKLAATAAATGIALATLAPSLPVVPVPTPLPVDPSVETSAPDPTGSVETAAPVETGAALPSCHSSSGGGFTVSYPAGWNTLADGSEWSCRLFDPNPILIGVDTELPDVAVLAWVEEQRYADVVTGYRTQGTSSTTTDESGTIAGRDATGLELENNGTGYYEKGVLQTVVLIDLGANGTLVFESVGTPGDLYNARLEGLGTVIQSLVLD
ncbi:MAG TPA: hypothetical protein VES19_13495 [Candidatus Limnocylindrales bacterium]|nr:hypothetical protein [Candidatus Limnocylindrales bacterium]